MGKDSSIQWTDHTFNPWRGCTRVSPGCDHCYAEAWSKRNPKSLGVWGDDGTRVIAADSYWREPLRWNREAEKAGVRARVFCASLADVFEDRPELFAPRCRLARLIVDTPHLDWLLLTKRPENAGRLWWEARVAAAYSIDDLRKSWPANVWLGCTVENQAQADARIPHLLRVPAAVRFLSMEPLLSRVTLVDFLWKNLDVTGNFRTHRGKRQVQFTHEGPLGGIHWVICGGESGPMARPFDLAWARSLRDQCKEVGVAFFMKQMGARPFDTKPGIGPLGLRDKHGGDPSEWPADLRVRQFPKVRPGAEEER